MRISLGWLLLYAVLSSGITGASRTLRMNCVIVEAGPVVVGVSLLGVGEARGGVAADCFMASLWTLDSGVMLVL